MIPCNMKFIVNPKYEPLRPFIESIPSVFDDQGTVVYQGRNTIREFFTDNTHLVVKRFGRMNVLKRVIYSFFRDNKAIRSYRHAEQILQRGFQTPEPIAYIEERKNGLLSDLYYICCYTKACDIKSQLIDREPYNESLLHAYAIFVASLHTHGILHRDLNPTNVLYEVSERGDYQFTLIDINRMTFYDDEVPPIKCMHNLTLFWWLSPVYRAMLDIYAQQRGWSRQDVLKAIRIKEKHDDRWIRRKNFTAIFKHKI